MRSHCWLFLVWEIDKGKEKKWGKIAVKEGLFLLKTSTLVCLKHVQISLYNFSISKRQHDLFSWKAFAVNSSLLSVPLFLQYQQNLNTVIRYCTNGFPRRFSLPLIWPCCSGEVRSPYHNIMSSFLPPLSCHFIFIASPSEFTPLSS